MEMQEGFIDTANNHNPFCFTVGLLTISLLGICQISLGPLLI